jgi:15-cis-phytoene synthase
MAIILVRAASPGLSAADSISHQGTLQCSTLLKTKRPAARRWMPCSLIGLHPSDVGRPSPAVYSSLAVNPAGEAVVSSEQKVYDVVLKQAALLKRQLRTPVLDARPQDMDMPRNGLKEAYDRCGEICEEYAKTFYLGTYGIYMGSIFFSNSTISSFQSASITHATSSSQELC